MKKFIYFSILLVFAFTSCEQDEIIDPTSDRDAELIGTTLKGKLDNVTICHYDAEMDIWKSISINGNALTVHLNHGDVQLIDADGDGWVTFENECVDGGDCDDTNSDINPSAEEICDNGIDDNCNGEIDEGCVVVLEIGDLHEGGIIFYLDDTGQHGLVAAPTDQGEGAYIFDEAILLCENLVIDGNDNWELPNQDNLDLMYTNLHLAGLGNFSSVTYWSRTLHVYGTAWVQAFDGGGVYFADIDGPAGYVRAISYF